MTKKLTLLFALIAMAVGACKHPDSAENGIPNGKGENYRVVTIDSCQYIIMYGLYTDANTTMVHKGNCNNPIHKFQK